MVDIILFKSEIEWDIYLIESNQYKNELLKCTDRQSLKKKVILKHFPKYVWIARAIVEDSILFDLIYDSTDIASGHFCIDFILHEQGVKLYLLNNLKKWRSIYVDHRDGPKLGEKLYESMLKELK